MHCRQRSTDRQKTAIMRAEYPAPLLLPSLVSLARSYLYLDDEGAVQGPFSGSDLLGWFDEGYFQPTTRILQASADTDAAKVDKSAFKPFAAFFPHTQKAQTQVEAAAPNQTTTTTPAASAQPATEPAVIVEDEEDETDAKPAVTTAAVAADVVPKESSTAEAVESAPAASATDAAAPASDSSAPAASVAPATAASPQTDWYYLDDTSLERGPFPSSDMAAWFTAGFFTAATKVRTAAEKECKPFGERNEQQESFMKPSAGAATGGAHAASTEGSTAAAASSAVPINIEDQFETDMMDDEEEEDEDEQQEVEDDTEQKASDKVGASEEKKSEGADSNAAVKPKVVSPALLAWYYIDTSGQEQGPFTPASMLKWHRANFFAFNDTPLRRVDEEDATPLSKRTTAPSFFDAVLPRPPVSRENRWYYLDSRGTEQGPFTEAQMRGWWLGGYLKPTLKVRQVGEDESEFKEICERKGEQECAFTKGENSHPQPQPLLPTPTPVAAAQTQMQPQPQHAQFQYPPVYLAQHPHAPPPPPHPAAPYGYAAPPPANPYWAGAGGPAPPFAYAGHNPYGNPYGPSGPGAAHAGYHSAPYGAPPPPPPPRDRSWNASASGEYAQSASFSGHRGRGRHVVGGAYAESRAPHDPLSTYAHPAALEAWQEDRNKRQRR